MRTGARAAVPHDHPPREAPAPAGVRRSRPRRPLPPARAHRVT
ncbi:hypothetical protein QC281_04350 [Streptomyces sp. DH17]|nr:hypothetical protein [Streptomyces sp. DH17]